MGSIFKVLSIELFVFVKLLVQTYCYCHFSEHKFIFRDKRLGTNEAFFLSLMYVPSNLPHFSI